MYQQQTTTDISEMAGQIHDCYQYEDGYDLGDNDGQIFEASMSASIQHSTCMLKKSGTTSSSYYWL